jgi:hydroxypyruvate isomerase
VPETGAWVAYHAGMRFEPNLSMLFTDLPLLARPAAAASAGFDAAELWWPFEEPDPGPSRLDGLVDAFETAGLGLACLNFYAGDLAAGSRGLLAIPGAEAAFRANVDVAVGLAERLGCRVLNALYGRRLPGTSADLSDGLAIQNLAIAVTAADRIGARVVVEAVNPVEQPGYGLPHVDDAAAFLDRARDATGAEAWLSFDAYHVLMAGDDLAGSVDRHGDRIAHVQLADVPGRHEPGSGTMDVAGLLRRLDGLGYRGWVGLEYVPSVESGASLRQAMAVLAPLSGASD